MAWYWIAMIATASALAGGIGVIIFLIDAIAPPNW